MSGALEGVKVLEVAAWTFVPAAGAVLSDWGADVIKVEHPETGDPQRGLVSMGIIPGGDSAVNFIIEQPNRGKRSIGLDISTDEGREILYKLAAQCDVFLTSFLPEVRQKLKIDVEHIQAINPKVVYARGSGQGVKGPDASKGGYDGASFWARSGISNALTPECAEFPIGGRPAFGDLAGGMTIAGGIAAALFKRERTGEGQVVDVSLMSLAMWMLSPDIVAAGLYGGDPLPQFDHYTTPNPIVGFYKTKDDRYVSLMMLQSDRFWPELVTALGKPELIDDERFKDGGARFMNSRECVAILDETFGSKTLAELKEAFAGLKGVWAPVQEAGELFDDPQAVENGYLTTVNRADGVSFQLVASPVQINEEQAPLVPAPEHGEHTDAILEELGLDWDQIIALKVSGAVL